MPTAVASDPVEARTRELGAAIHAAEPRPPLRDRASDGRLEALAEKPHLRAALFRFVDSAPACSGARERGAHLRAYVRQVPSGELPGALRSLAAPRLGASLAPIAGFAARPAIRLMARRFIAGRDVAAAERELRRGWLRGEHLALDLLGEATVTAPEADTYRDRCLIELERLTQACATWPEHPLLAESDRHGPIPRADLSLKLTALTPLLHPEAPARGAADAAPRLRALAVAAREQGAHLHLDMESLDTREMLLRCAEGLLAEPEFREGPTVGVVVQAYLRDAEEVLERVLASPLCRRGVPLTIRLVKGAYWEHEIAEAGQCGWPAPVWGSKAETDRSFERLTRLLLERAEDIRPAIASHNLRSLAHAIAVNESLGGRPEDLELQVLRGLGDSLARALAADGRRVRVYTPVGDLVAGMAYLVRRLLENSSSQGFLVRSRHGSLEELLAAP